MKLYVVGFGPGNYEGMTVQARSAIEQSDVIVGYIVYTDIIKEYFPDKSFVSTHMKQEKERVILAFKSAADGNVTALVCSGDSGVYGMAGLAFELSENFPEVDIEIVPGVTAALSGGAVLGAPLTSDFVVISLSDLLTSWDKIEKRIECAAMGDFAAAIYNPMSNKRRDNLRKACEIMLRYRSPKTVCGYVKNIGRSGQEMKILTLAELKNAQVDMFTTVFVGNSNTKLINGRMVTPRGYDV